MRRVLVTGASGQLGAYLLRERPPDCELIPWMGTESVDLTDPHAIATGFRAARPDVVIHAAPRILGRLQEATAAPGRSPIAQTIFRKAST